MPETGPLMEVHHSSQDAQCSLVSGLRDPVEGSSRERILSCSCPQPFRPHPGLTLGQEDSGHRGQQQKEHWLQSQTDRGLYDSSALGKLCGLGQVI